MSVLVYNKENKLKIQSLYKLPDYNFTVPVYVVSQNLILVNTSIKVAKELANLLEWKLVGEDIPSVPLTHSQFGSNSTITITFGDVAENHVRMEKIGKMAKEGINIEKLIQIQSNLKDINVTSELIYLPLPEELKEYKDEAAILIIRNGVNKLLSINGIEDGSKKLFKEQSQLEVDKKALMRGKVVNKKARWNLCFDDIGHKPNYEEGIGTVVSYNDIPITNVMKNILPLYFGSESIDLKAEANYYYDIKQCYIGFHGDGERKIVIALRLGASMPLYYQWYFQSSPVGKRVKINLNDGDMYIMSSKAVGNDWLKKKIPTLRHAAGLENVKALKL